MPYITATPTWSAGVTLTVDEDWLNDSASAVRVSREALTGAAPGGIRLLPGQAYPFSANDTVRCRAESGNVAGIWREAL